MAVAFVPLQRLVPKRPHGTGGVQRNGSGWSWLLSKKGQRYLGPTFPTRGEALEALDLAVGAIGRGEEPILAKKQAGGRVRSKTIQPAALLRMVRDEPKIEYPDIDRPVTRGDCAMMPRPCPFVSCAHHLYLDVNDETGAIKFNRPDLEVWEMEETCALDVADRGGITLEEIGRWSNLTRERIRQVEVRGLTKIKNADRGELAALRAPEHGTHATATAPKAGCP